MDELKIRKDGIYLNNQKLNGVQAIKTKSTIESNHATIFLFTFFKSWSVVWVLFYYTKFIKEHYEHERNF